MTLNGVMALILRYFAEFGSFRGALRISGKRCRRKKSLRSLSHLLMSFLWWLGIRTERKRGTGEMWDRTE